jgi:hypothetical protein
MMSGMPSAGANGISTFQGFRSPGEGLAYLDSAICWSKLFRFLFDHHSALCLLIGCACLAQHLSLQNFYRMPRGDFQALLILELS